ncbi:MAG: 4-alpha-glucanotransferase [Paludibacteraceae bacterium]
MKIHFKVPYFTRWGQRLMVTGNVPELGNGDFSKALFLHFQGHEDWTADVDIQFPQNNEIRYKYVLFNEYTGVYLEEWGDNRILKMLDTDLEHLFCFDTWNSSGSVENAFLTAPFQKVLLKEKITSPTKGESKKITHIFKVKAPLLHESQMLCAVGNCPELGDWSVNNAMLMQKEGDFWITKLDLSKVNYEVNYKYGIFDAASGHFLYFEQGPDRIAPVIQMKKTLIVVENGFVRVDNRSWRGAGVGLPVFSIRTRRSFGVGDFYDLKLLVDWAEKVGLKLIQVLPLNDTIGTHTDEDVLPYAAISAFALNPLFLSLPAIGKLPENNELQIQYIPKQAELNAQDLVPFLEVINFKLKYARALYQHQKKEFLNNSDFLTFFEKNSHWLIPYAAYCVLRDMNHTNDYRQWNEFATFDKVKIAEFVSPSQSHYDDVAINYFIQYHLHIQLSEAAAYAHEHGVVLKGDIPIGVNKNSVDTWIAPELFQMDMNAGAPPDMFAIKGQNWELPTYNWTAMQGTGFDWWKKRFSQMSNYFDTFRIDHILGFFRIWEIPEDQIEGIMGHLTPSVPIHINEFVEKGVWFDYNRFCKPYITDHILWILFQEQANWVKSNCLQIEDGWVLRLKPEYNSQGYVEQLYNEGKITEKMKWGLFDLISNVLFFEKEDSNGTQYYPRYGMHFLSTYSDLDDYTKQKLDELYIDYFYHRQDANWYNSGMEKLPALKRSTNMLICGEDLGMMTPCVTAVMKELGILSLEVQRAPKSNKIDFFIRLMPLIYRWSHLLLTI